MDPITRFANILLIELVVSYFGFMIGTVSKGAMMRFFIGQFQVSVAFFMACIVAIVMIKVGCRFGWITLDASGWPRFGKKTITCFVAEVME